MGTTRNSDIAIKNEINLIFKMDEKVVFAKTIDNNQYKFKNIGEIEEYLENDTDLKIRNLHADKVELDKNYLVYIISEYSECYNSGIIDWKFAYDDLPFIRLKKLYRWMPITVNIGVHTDMGAAGGMGLFSSHASNMILSIIQTIIEKTIVAIAKKILNNTNKEKVYGFFKDNYGVDREYISKVINCREIWKKGFIDSNIYSAKEKYEKRIMKDLDYKYNKKTKKWKKIYLYKNN